MKNYFDSRLKQLMLALAIILVFSTNTFSQILLSEVTKSAHFDYSKLAQIDAEVNKYVANHWLTGTSVIIVKDNKVVYYKGLGYANEASKKPMPANAIYRIMSQTKAITSLAVLQLVEQGKIGLDQKVSDFISTFKNPKVLDHLNTNDSTYTTIPAKREITIRDLLTHNSGIDYTDIGSDKMNAIYTKAGVPSGLGEFKESLLEKMTKLGSLPLGHQPGEKFTYGLNTDLLGCIVEMVSGTTLENIFKKIFLIH